MPYSSWLDGTGKVVLSISSGGSYLEVMVPWAYRVMEAGLKDLQVIVAGLQDRQSEMSPLLVGLWALRRTSEGWKRPSSLMSAEVWLSLCTS